ncbi:MAG: hypothetical protein ACLPKE_14830 [Streptosporangiaceae bacterium]
MNYITKSLPAMILLSAAAMLLMLSEAFDVAGLASLTPASLGVANDLSHAGDWLTFAAIVVGLLALGTATWATVLANNWAAVAEMGAGMAGVITIAVGDLINATTSENSASAAHILQAIGFGVLTLLVLGHAAQRSLAEQDVSARPRQAALWLVASAGLATLAVGVSLTPAINSKGLAIAAGILLASGTGILAGVLIAASAGGFRMAGSAIAGLILLSVGYIGATIVAGMYYGPDAVTNWLNGALGLRIGPSIVETISTLGLLVLALAAWTQVRRLAGQKQSGSATPPQPSQGWLLADR